MGMLIHNRHSVMVENEKAQSEVVEPKVEEVAVEVAEVSEEKKKPGRKPKAE